MLVAAFAVSIAALVVSAAAAFFTWQQADAAKKTAGIEAQRHLAERQPEFSGLITSNIDAFDQLEVRLDRGGPLVEVTVTVVEGEGVQFEGGQTGMPDGEPGPSASTVETLRLGASVRWSLVNLTGRRASTRIRVVAECRGEAGDTWEASFWVDLPQRPWIEFV